jgi:hypothetical protein
MYDKHIISAGSLRNLGDGSGYSLGARLPYYRGQPLSVVEDVAITVDGVKVPRADVRFSVRGESFTFDEMESVTDKRWEFGEVADIIVLQAGGLAPGAHEVIAAVQLRISYLPWSPVTTCTRTETIAA